MSVCHRLHLPVPLGSKNAKELYSFTIESQSIAGVRAAIY
jgi:hypothetical protein